VPDVRRYCLVPPLELPHHRGITTVPVLQSGAARNLAVTTVVVKQMRAPRMAAPSLSGYAGLRGLGFLSCRPSGPSVGKDWASLARRSQHEDHDQEAHGDARRGDRVAELIARGQRADQ